MSVFSNFILRSNLESLNVLDRDGAVLLFPDLTSIATMSGPSSMTKSNSMRPGSFLLMKWYLAIPAFIRHSATMFSVNAPCL